MPSPFGHSLSLLLLLPLKKFYNLPLLGLPKRVWLVLLFLVNAPDLDLIPALFWPQRWDEFHREWGHNLFYVTLVALLTSFLLARFDQSLPRLKVFFLAWSLMGCHLFLDLFTYQPWSHHFHGVPFFFPFSEKHFHLSFPLFPTLETPGGKALAHEPLYLSFWTTTLPRVLFREAVGVLALFGGLSLMAKVRLWWKKPSVN